MLSIDVSHPPQRGLLFFPEELVSSESQVRVVESISEILLWNYLVDYGIKLANQLEIPEK